MFKPTLSDRLVPIIWLLICCAVSLACIDKVRSQEIQITADAPQSFELRASDGAVLKEMVNGQLAVIRRPTLEACQAAGKTELMKLTADSASFRCIQVNTFTATGTCNGVPQPGPDEAIEGKLDAEGFTIVGKLETEACVNDDTDWKITVVKWRKKPSWRDGCWERIETPLKECGKEPVAEESTPDTGVTDEQSPWVAGVDYPYGEPCPAAAAKAGCYVPSLVATRECPQGAEEYCSLPLPLPGAAE